VNVAQKNHHTKFFQARSQDNVPMYWHVHTFTGKVQAFLFNKNIIIIIIIIYFSLLLAYFFYILFYFLITTVYFKNPND
jgi:hypothetical protein